MGRNGSFWKRIGIRRWVGDAVTLLVLGASAYLLFRASPALRPLEGTLLMGAAAGLVLVGRRWFFWQRRLAPDGFIADWSRRIVEGDRTPQEPPAGLRRELVLAASALNVLLEEDLRTQTELDRLRKAVGREWEELDHLLDQAHKRRGREMAARTSAQERLSAFGRNLKSAIDGPLRFDQIELNHRLRADQHRLQGQALRTSLEQAQAGMDQFENLLEELQSTFPRLRREEDILGRLADSSIRQGARLGLAVKGLVAHTPRLLEETKGRTEQLQRFRHSADEVRDQAEALARRIDAFRDESQQRIRSLGVAHGSLRIIDQAAQQTGLLAVNAAILAQKGGGSAGIQAIGGRLRSLANQTSEGASDLERSLDQHQRELERETNGLWDLQEVTHHLRAGLHELLRVAGHLDHQGQDLERALEAHLGLVDQVRQAADRAELSLHEVRERSAAIESALGRQWGVEAKISPERERLVRIGKRLMEVGDEFARIGQKNLDETWEILVGHQEIRRSDAYLQIAAGDLSGLLKVSEDVSSASWDRLAWARAQRRPRLLAGIPAQPPAGWRHASGEIRLLLAGLDALDQPEPSALEAWSCDEDARMWHLKLIEPLRTEDHRLSLLETLKESPLEACFPGLDLRISPEGANLLLPTPYPGFPAFLGGLGLGMPVETEPWRDRFRPVEPVPRAVQRLVWIGPEANPAHRVDLMRLIHAWVRDDHRHEVFMPWLPYDGHRPPCPWLAEGEVPDRLEGSPVFRCVGLDVDPAVLHPLRDRLLEAGAVEGEGGAVLCATALAHAHPEALLLRLFQADAGLAGSFHPELVPLQVRLRDEVLGGDTGDPYVAAWRLLEDMQRKGWALPLPPA
ncbi:methyl-accepting chemotaxis protein [Geothrix sp. 21YS21S-4]|uniref:methyl-accepting chemotaxis protein n=1 Tax=Geothrix sp. 21YS21S-4 TaxID=3068889 RepID=UPI0027BA16C3|nr:methyl-accepting chemotaxis protein [Geothrix sp. 21YS21S-4]